MTNGAYRLTEAAAKDIDDILTTTARTFGWTQHDLYSALIERGIEHVARFPDRPGSRGRAELSPGVRSFHLALASTRISGARHVIYYVRRDIDGKEGVLVLRVLHDRMEPRRHLPAMS